MAKEISKQARISGPADPSFVLDDYVLYNLVRTASTYNDVMAGALKMYKLDTMKWRILMLLNDKSPSSVGELARRSVTKMPTLTRMLIRMEKEGLVNRRSLEGDRRVVEVTMTSQAEVTLKLVQQVGQNVFESAFSGIDIQEIASTTASLKRIRQNLNKRPFHGGE
jgi:DNA-binding MarR family transcriptional regulator